MRQTSRHDMRYTARYGMPEVCSVTRRATCLCARRSHPRFRDGKDEYKRHEDIQEWLQTHEVGSWVALDDLPLGDHLENAVKTDPGSGITERNVRQATMILNFPR